MNWLIFAGILIHYVSPFAAGQCAGYCKYQGTCTLNIYGDPRCTCVIGFTGSRCTSNALSPMASTLAKNNTEITVAEASKYTSDAFQMFTNHFNLGFTNIAESVEKTTEIIEDVVLDLAVRLNDDWDIDLTGITNTIADLTTLIHRGIDETACTVNNEEYGNCTIPRQQANLLLEKSDDNLVEMVNLMLSTRDMRYVDHPQLINDAFQKVSMSIVKTRGGNLQSNYDANFGQMTLPYWETFQDRVRYEDVMMNVMTYKSSPYKSVYNPESADSSIVKTVVRNRNGNIQLNDPNDPVEIAIDTSQIIQNKGSLLPMDVTEVDGQSVSTCIVNMNYSAQAIMTEIKIDSFLTCTTLGKYGTSGYPTSTDFDFVVVTRGLNGVTKSGPSGLIFDFSDQSLIITTLNDNYLEDVPIEPIVMTLQCPDDTLYGRETFQLSVDVNGYGPRILAHARLLRSMGTKKAYAFQLILRHDISNFILSTDRQGRLKFSLTTDREIRHCTHSEISLSRTLCACLEPPDVTTDESNHMCRTGELKVSYLDTESYNWTKSELVKITKQDSGTLKFKSQFFGTFAASSIFFGPTPIDFDFIFLNFIERLLDAPHVLIIDVSLLVIFMLLVIPLRRADKKDRILWAYLPLIDNVPDGDEIYYISVYTALRSSKQMTATVFFRLIGSKRGSEIHVLVDGQRNNFMRGTCSNFKLVTKTDLGSLERLKIWHDNKGDSPKWLLNKIVILQESTGIRYVFICGQWLSLDCEDGQNWRTLYPITKETINGDIIFRENSRKRLFDDNLWFSISKRPYHSRYSRVQRLWSLIALLFLSMLTSAMWFGQEKEEEPDIENPYTATVKLGPLTFSAKQIYVGLMSAGIAFLPSIVIISMFRHRKFKGETSACTVNDKKYSPHVMSEKKYKPSVQRLLPWWTIFFAYAIVIACIGTCGFFTFLYSLQFGRDKSNDWMLSFLIGTIQSILLLEPVKVAVLAIIFACLLKRLAGEELQDSPNPEVFHEPDLNSTIENLESQPTEEVLDSCGTVIKYCPCPDAKQVHLEFRQQRRRLQLDRQLATLFRDFLWKILYVAIVAIICSHNMVTVLQRQNDHLIGSVNNTYLVNTTDDIYTWLTDFFMPAVFPKWKGNGTVPRTAYERRFMYNEYNYRLGLVRLRQIRTRGNCDIPYPMEKVLSVCEYGYSFKHEDTENYCEEWQPYNDSCIDINSYSKDAFLYRDSTSTNALPYLGISALYGGGGYVIDIGPKQSLALTEVNNLKNNMWIDINTRAIFVDCVSFNANTRLFSHVKVVFELTQYGMYTMTVHSWSFNLYPYVHTWDYFVLGFQVIFLLIVFARIILYIVEIYKTRSNCYKTFTIWSRGLELFLAVSATALYCARIHQTIKGIEDVRNNAGKNKHISFELVELFDNIYQYCLASVLFIISLDLLKPLNLNYHLFIMYTSLVKARLTLASFSLLLVILLFAFASYLSVTVGSTVAAFKDLPSSLLTLFRFLLLMVSLGKYPQMESIQAQIAMALFAFTVSICAVNIFVTILTMYFTEVAEIQTGSSKLDNLVFNQELNDHLWWRLETTMKDLCCSKKEVIIEKEEIVKLDENVEDLPVEKFGHLGQYVLTTAIEDIEFHNLVFNSALWCDQKRKADMIMLHCVVIRNKSQTFYRFIHPENGSARIIITFEDSCCAGLQDIQFYEVKNLKCTDSYIIQYRDKLKSSVFEGVSSGYFPSWGEFKLELFCIEDRNNENIKLLHYAKDSWDSLPLTQITEHVYGCTMTTLPVRMVAIEAKDQNRIEDKPSSKGIEEYEVSTEGGTVSMECNSKISLTFEPFAVQTKCNVTLQVETVGVTPILHFTTSTDVTKPVQVTLPDTYSSQNQNYMDLSDKLVIAIKRGDSQWSNSPSTVLRENKQYSFKIRNITAIETVSVFVKISEIRFVDLPMLPTEIITTDIGDYYSTTDLSRGNCSSIVLPDAELNVRKAIEYVSRQEPVAEKWREIAAILCEEVPFFFIDTEANVNKEHSSSKSIALPWTCQEKCFYLLKKSCAKRKGFTIDAIVELLQFLDMHFLAESLKRLFE